MKNRQSVMLIGAMVVGLITSSTVFADSDKGYQIAAERKQRDAGWGDSVAQLSMELTNANGNTSSRKLRIKSLEVINDGDKGLTIFDEPKDVRGTVFLSYSHSTEPDDQWIFLPALKRVKRIASRNKSGPFMGSEFAYEDLSSFELEKYTFNYLRDETLNGQEVFVVEQVPTDKFSGYSSQLVWMDKVHYRPLKVEFYDRRKNHLKTLTFKDYQQYLDKFWRPSELVMINHQNKKMTRLMTENLTFDNGLTERDFSKSSIKRAR
ncbi:outer membrane lipoprotein-sorting protein [Veronia pacifica]|nr:outer membrane lipoprotein-sorting protein [Veronia pacifica]